MRGGPDTPELHPLPADHAGHKNPRRDSKQRLCRLQTTAFSPLQPCFGKIMGRQTDTITMEQEERRHSSSPQPRVLPTSAIFRSIQSFCVPGDVHDGTGAKRNTNCKHSSQKFGIGTVNMTTELDSELVEHGRWCYEIGAQFERNGKYEEAMEMLRQYLAIAQRLHVLSHTFPLLFPGFLSRCPA